MPGAGRDLAERVRTHLFVVCPNNSGSSFLAAALGACWATWRLPREGPGVCGFAGPVTWEAQAADGAHIGLVWAAERRWQDLFTNPCNYNWPRTRRAWYFHARAHVADASVFVTKSA